MLTHLSLRLRVFLFFALLGLGSVVGVGVALAVGMRAAQAGDVSSGFIQAGVISTFAILALTAGIWLLFDEHVAKPIEGLAAQLRFGAHVSVAREADGERAKYLGDLAPAAEEVTRQLVDGSANTAGAIAQKTQRLQQEKDQLTALLTEIPMAMILVNAQHQIVLYDGQAAAVLAQIHTPRLNAHIYDYFDRKPIEAAWEKLMQTGKDVSFTANGAQREQSYQLRMQPLDKGTGYMLIVDDAAANIAPQAARPLIYDFALMDHSEGTSIDQLPLSELTYVVFDTETTGLLPHKDEVVQIGAVRVVRGTIVPGEEIDRLVNPKIPIPAASTRVHRISDAMVANADQIDQVLPSFHNFAKDAVIVAHNAPFDMAFMHRYGKRQNLDWPHPVVDTVLLSAVVFGASETHTLDALCQRLGVTIPLAQRHTAMGDARATAEVLCRMIPMLEARGITSFGDLLEETRKHGRILKDLNG
ncbi:MAG: 3'-5' exonuclease [Thalassovita sp.]